MLFRSKLIRGYPHLISFTEAFSCGISAIEGNPATSTAVQAMDLWGIDLEPHRASPLTSLCLREADLVLAMSREHLLSISRMDPRSLHKATTLGHVVEAAGEISRRLGDKTPGSETEARRRIGEVLHLLGEMSPERGFSADMYSRGSDIIDPIGSSLQVYIGVAEDIDNSLDSVMRAFFGASGEDSWPGGGVLE